MKGLWQMAAACACLLTAAAAQACSAVAAEDVLANFADRNGNGSISRREWRELAKHPQIKDLVLKFRAGSRAEFRRLDRNRNGRIEWEERVGLLERVAYVRHPCADWEEEMLRLQQQEQQQEQQAPQ